jgi:hypothetical protein
MRRLLISLAAALAVAGNAQAAGTKAVKDWLGVCANTLACTAFGFAPEDDENGGYLLIQRDGGPGAAPRIAVVFDPADKQPAADWTLQLDGHPIAGVGPVHAAGGESGARALLRGRPASALIAALRNGKSLEVLAGGTSQVQISLAGSAAILLWLDDQQGRVDTVTALARPGAKPASAVPTPAPAPLIRAAPPVVQNGVPDHAPKGMTKGIADCDAEAETPDEVVARLAPGVMLWGPQCTSGAYNAVNVFFIGDEHAKGLKRVRFPEPPGAGQASDDLLFNPGFDPKTQTLSIFSKARGVGDCGESADWVWDGRAFQLISDNIMPACRGVLPDDWPPLFVSRQR